METDDYFAKMMFSSINTEAYFECNDDSPSTASDYGINSVLTEKALTSHRKTLPNPVIAAQKSEANKLNQLISSQTSCGFIQSSEEKFPTYAHGVYVPKKLAEACKTDGKVGKLTSADKKRRERNNREQQRSCKISKQIDQLKELLHSSGFKMKKNSKSSVLAGVAEYVKELQIQSQEVNRDIRRAMIQSDVCSTDKGKDSFFLDGDSVDFQYRNMFFSSPIPIALARIDGRFFDCNRTFLDAARLTKDVLDSITLYKLIEPSSLQAAHSCIAEMLDSMSQSEHFFVRSTIRSDVGNGNPQGETGFLGLSLIRYGTVKRQCRAVQDGVEWYGALSVIPIGILTAISTPS